MTTVVVARSPAAITSRTARACDAPARGSVSPCPHPAIPNRTKTAFVFAGGGSFGAIQVGMMQSLARRGIGADMVVGSSVGALNGAFYAGDPTVDGVERLAEYLARLETPGRFPFTWRTLLGFLWRRDFLISP